MLLWLQYTNKKLFDYWTASGNSSVGATSKEMLHYIKPNLFDYWPVPGNSGVGATSKEMLLSTYKTWLNNHWTVHYGKSGVEATTEEMLHSEIISKNNNYEHFWIEFHDKLWSSKRRVGATSKEMLLYTNKTWLSNYWKVSGKSWCWSYFRGNAPFRDNIQNNI